MKNLVNLTGKKIVVTGASSGIGQSIAIMCSELGAQVILIARREDRLKETLTMMEAGEHSYFVADLSETEKIAELVPKIVERVGKIDGLVHAAGVTYELSLAVSDVLKYEPMMRLNYYAFAELLRLFFKRKYSNDGMSVVGISSSAVLKSYVGSLYSATKAAMETFANSAQIELVPKRKIRVNMIRPNMVKTDMTERFFSDNSSEYLQDAFPLGVIQSEDIAGCVCFLLSDAASKITNQKILIDSGSSFSRIKY